MQGQYKNQFEMEYYMAVNLFRSDPAQFVPFIKDLKKAVPELKRSNDLIDTVCKNLNGLKAQGKICFEETANKACI